MDEQNYAQSLFLAAKNGDWNSYCALTRGWNQTLWPQALAMTGNDPQTAQAALQAAQTQSYCQLGGVQDLNGLYALLQQQLAAACTQLPPSDPAQNATSVGTKRAAPAGGKPGLRLAALIAALALLVTGVFGTILQVRAVERFPVPGSASPLPAEPLPDTGDPEQPGEDRNAAALSAYVELLTKERDAIEGYLWQKGGYSLETLTEEQQPKPVVLADVWGDELPELIYVSVPDPEAEYSYLTYLNIVGWDDGIRPLYSGMWDVLAGGGFDYYLYQLQGDKTLYAYCSHGDESWVKEYLRFADSSGVLEDESVLRWASTAKYDDGDYHYEISCTKEGEPIDEALYDKAVAAMEANTARVLMSSRRSTDFAEQYTAQHGEAAESVSEALSRLIAQLAPDCGALEIEPEAASDEMRSFLLQFVAWYNDGENGDEFHCETAGQDGTNLIASIVNNGSCVRFSLYPGEGQQNFWGESDPRGWAKEYGAYAAYDVQSVDWIAEHVFHLSPADILLLSQRGEQEERFYRQTAENGKEYYYRGIGGVGDPFLKIVPDSITLEGGKYTVVYEVYFDTDWASRWPSSSAEYEYSACAVLGYEEIDGSRYWTLYSNSRELPEAPAEEAAENLFAEMPQRYLYTSGIGAWGTTLVLDADGSFRGHFEDSNLGESGDGYDGTLYYSDFRGVFKNPKKLNAYTYSFELDSLEYLGELGSEEIRDFGYGRTRTVFTEAYGVYDGETFLYYTEGAPSYKLPKDFLQWIHAVSGTPSGRRTPYGGIYNLTSLAGFRAYAVASSQCSGWNEAYRHFVMDQEYFGDGDLAVGYGSLFYNETEPCYALRDSEGSGTPELVIFNGKDSEEEQADYIFRYQSGAVRFVEAVPHDSDFGGALAVSWRELQDHGWNWFAARYFGGQGGKTIPCTLPLSETESTELRWGWELFRQAPGKLQNELAEAGCALCLSGEGCAKALATLGFDAVEEARHGTLRICFGTRLLYWDDELYTLLAVVVTDGSGFTQTLRSLTDLEALSEEAGDAVRALLSEYLTGESGAAVYITAPELVRFFLVGEGLGGAAVGRLFPLLRQSYGEDCGIFAYSYNCPAYLSATGSREKLDGLHNLLNSEDLLAALLSGLRRAGSDHWLPCAAGTLKEAHATETLWKSLKEGAAANKEAEPVGYRRVTIAGAETLTVSDPKGTVLAAVTDGTIRSEADAPLLLLQEGDGYSVYAKEDADLLLSVNAGEGKTLSVIRQSGSLSSDTLHTDAECRGLERTEGAGFCVQLSPEEKGETAVYELDAEGRALRRFDAAGEAHKAIFGNDVFGWLFVGLAGLGLVLGIVSLILLLKAKKRR